MNTRETLRTVCDDRLEKAERQPIAMAVELLQEIVDEHRDPESSNYNECENGADCFFCELALIVIQRLKHE